MFVRNGQALGSVLHTESGAEPPEPTESPEPESPVAMAEPAKVAQVEAPARGGPNGTREAWAAFLDSQGIEYPEDPEEAGRNDLIDLWDNREGGE